jgi:hypothetical protein
VNEPRHQPCARCTGLEEQLHELRGVNEALVDQVTHLWRVLAEADGIAEPVGLQRLPKLRPRRG